MSRHASAAETSTRIVEDWRQRGLCADTPFPDLWYPDGEGQKYTEQIAEAKAVCARCPVASRCAEAGRREKWGIWAGRTETERGVLRNRGDRKWATT